MDVRHPMGCYIHFLSKIFFMIRSVKAKEQSKLKITRNDRHYLPCKSSRPEVFCNKCVYESLSVGFSV